MRFTVLAVGFLLAPALQAQTADLVVTFDRATSHGDALSLVHQLAADVPVEREGTQFEPVTTSAGLEAPPDAEAVRALFAAGAISVEVVRPAAQLASFGVPIDVEAYEADRSTPAYYAKVSFASSTPTPVARRIVTAALGVEAGGVTKSANVVRLRVAAGDANELATALRASEGVVAARVQR